MKEIIVIPAQSNNNAGWVDTAIDLAQGQSLHIMAMGHTNCRQNPPNDCPSGPDGIPGPSPSFVWPSQMFMALIGYIGSIAPASFTVSDPDPRAIFVGSSYQGIVQQDGRLYLCVNDSVSWFWDNLGAYTATIDAPSIDNGPNHCSDNWLRSPQGN